jgi:lipopolysaccharide heptosyltransferase II
LPKEISKILIIRLSSLGDVILTSPLIRLLHKKFPDVGIEFLVRKEYADLVRFNPYLTNIIEFDAKDGLAGLAKLKSLIRYQKYDIILDLHGSLRSNYLLIWKRLNPFHSSSVYKINKNRLIRFLLVKWKINLYQKIYGCIPMVWEKYIKTAEPLGLQMDDGHLDLFLPQESEKGAENFLKTLPEGKWEVVMAPGAQHFTKRWPSESYSKLITKIYKTYEVKTILVGGENDQPVIAKIMTSIPNNIAVSTSGKMPLLETAALIKRAKLVISNDSGLMHVVSALDRPMIAIFGSTVKEFGFFPNNPKATVLENTGLYCRPCSHIGRSSCPEKHFRCMKEIPPLLILRKIKDLRIFKST